MTLQRSKSIYLRLGFLQNTLDTRLQQWRDSRVCILGLTQESGAVHTSGAEKRGINLSW